MGGASEEGLGKEEREGEIEVKYGHEEIVKLTRRPCMKLMKSRL